MNRTTQLGEIDLEHHRVPWKSANGWPENQRVQVAVNGNLPLDSLPLAMAYVPMQQWKEPYEGEKALERGTVFPELDLPFCGKRAR